MTERQQELSLLLRCWETSEAQKLKKMSLEQWTEIPGSNLEMSFSSDHRREQGFSYCFPIFFTIFILHELKEASWNHVTMVHYVTIEQVFILIDKDVLYFCCTECVSPSNAAAGSIELFTIIYHFQCLPLSIHISCHILLKIMSITSPLAQYSLDDATVLLKTSEIHEKDPSTASAQQDWNQNLANRTSCAQNQLSLREKLLPFDWNVIESENIIRFHSSFTKATSLKIVQTLCLLFRNKWCSAKLMPIWA